MSKVYSAHGAGNNTRTSRGDGGYQMDLGLVGLGRGVRRHRGCCSDEQEGRRYSFGTPPAVVLDYVKRRRLRLSSQEGGASCVRDLAGRAPLQRLVILKGLVKASPTTKCCEGKTGNSNETWKEELPTPFPVDEKGRLDPALVRKLKMMRVMRKHGFVRPQKRCVERGSGTEAAAAGSGKGLGREAVAIRRKLRRILSA